jgi:hypothetical protein
MGKLALAALLLAATSALADPPPAATGTSGNSTAVTGAMDAPKITTSATERAATDAEGLSPPLPGPKPVPKPGKPPRRHRRPPPAN